MNAYDTLDARGTTATARAYDRWAEQLIDGDPDPRSARRRLRSLSADLLAQVIFEGRMRGLLIGFVDGAGEIARPRELDRKDEQTIVDATIHVDQGELVQRPFARAISYFRQRVPVTRQSFDRMVGRERRRAFTVAGLAKNDFVQVAQEVMTRALKEQWEKKDFVQALATRFEEAGMTPLNPSHAATIFRTNLSTAHANGRLGAFTQPEVLKVRPFWQWHAIDDRTTRPSHRAMHGLAMAASDPAWQLIAPPCGFNCRCTITPIKREKAGEIVTGSDARVRALPDKGWAGSGGFPGDFEIAA